MTIDISKAIEWWAKHEHKGLTGMEALALVLEENERLKAAGRGVADLYENACDLDEAMGRLVECIVGDK